MPRGKNRPPRPRHHKNAPDTAAPVEETPAAAAASMPVSQSTAAAMMPPSVSVASAAAAVPTKRKYKSRPRVTTLIPQEVLLNNASLFTPHQVADAAAMPRKRGRPKGSKDIQPRKKPAPLKKAPPPTFLSTVDKRTFEAAQKRRQRHDSVKQKQHQRVQQAEAEFQKAQEKLNAAKKAAEKATQAAHAVALEDADDFLLEPNDWNEMYKLLLNFKEEHNLVNIKRSMTKEEYDWGPDEDGSHLKLVRKIAHWQQHQRKAKREGTLLEYQQILLDRLEFNWTPFQGPGPEKWTNMYERLKVYKNETGTCKVPRNYHDSKLAFWAKAQVTQYRNGKEGKKPCLTEERIKLLEDLGFDWGVPRVITPWETRFQELLVFRAEFGNVNVPWCWKRNKALASWVNRQRNLFRDLNDGKKSSITAEQIEKLKSVGFQWSTSGTGRYKNDIPSSPKQQQQQQEQQEEEYAFQVV